MSRAHDASRRPSRLHPGAGWSWTARLLLLALLATTLGAGPAEEAPVAEPALAVEEPIGPVDVLLARAQQLQGQALAWYRVTPAAGRIAWGGLAACALLALITTLDRTIRVRRSRVLPSSFRERFQTRLAEGQLDWGKGLDYCELNPSPAAQVALAALRRIGRPTADLDRAVSLARQVEVDQLRRHLGTLRRVAVLAPLVGLLGSLLLGSRALALLPAGAAWGPVVAAALTPLTAGVALAIVALLLFDGLTGRVETLGNELDRLGTELVDAIAAATPVVRSAVAPGYSTAPPPPPVERSTAAHTPHRGDPGPGGRERAPRTPHTQHRDHDRSRQGGSSGPQPGSRRDRRREHLDDDGF